MSQSTSTVWFELCSSYVKSSLWQVERCPTDSLSDLLEKLSKKTNISVEELSFTYQCEFGKIEGEDLRYFTESKQPIYKENGSVEWQTVYANNDSIESSEDLIPKSLVQTINLISELDDVSCPSGLAPVITVSLHNVFFELNDFGLIRKNADAFFDSQNVAAIEGVRLVDVNGEMPSITLLKTDGRTLVDMTFGESFESLEDELLASRISRGSHREYHYYFILRNKSRLPKWPISPDLQLAIAIRDGADFSIAGGIIEVQDSYSPALSKRWIFPKWNPQVEIPSDSKPHNLKEQIVQYIGT